MSTTSLIANLSLLLALVGTLVVLKYTGGLDILLHAFGWIKEFFSYMMRNKIFNTMMFIFLIGIAGFFVGFILSLNYACTSGNALRQQELGVVGGIGMFMSSIGNELNSTDPSYDDFIGNWTSPVTSTDDTSYQSLMKVKCINREPSLTIFGTLDFLNFKYWLLIMAIVGLIKIYSFTHKGG